MPTAVAAAAAPSLFLFFWKIDDNIFPVSVDFLLISSPELSKENDLNSSYCMHIE